MDFFRTKRADRVALIDPSYKQHNPVFVKRAADNNETDYEEFKSAFLSPQGDGQRQMAAGSAAPPEGNPFEVVTAECDIVTMIHKTYRPDPTAEGKFYALYSFDTFRVKNGKLTEHWDGSMLPMRRQQQQQPGQPQQ
jgi:predicted SnoaL-like aldol condensation-catalyzing enzyme